MRNRRDIVLNILLLGVAVQVLVAAQRTLPLDAAAGPPAQLAVGDALPLLEGLNADGTPLSVPLANGEGAITVLFAYDSECVHTDTVASDWTVFLADRTWRTGAIRTLALTRDLPGPAVSYAERFGWDVALLSAPDVAPSDIRHSLVSRTPWVFVFDSGGVLRYQGHGGELDLVEQAVESMTSAAQ